jgi:hypothetical protein
MIEATEISEFHDQIWLLLKMIEGVYVDDVSVIESGACASLAVKTVQHLGIQGHFPFEYFESNLTFQSSVEGPVDGAHATGGDNFPQLKLTNAEGYDNRMATFGTSDGVHWGDISSHPLLCLAASTHRQPERDTGIGRRF